MELLNAPSIFINDLKAKNKKSGETHARIFQINFILTDGRRTHKKFHFFNFFSIRMLAGAHSLNTAHFLSS
jgi:hypothetical protein